MFRIRKLTDDEFINLPMNKRVLNIGQRTSDTNHRMMLMLPGVLERYSEQEHTWLEVPIVDMPITANKGNI